MKTTVKYFLFGLIFFLSMSAEAQMKTIDNSFVVLNNQHPEKVAFYTQSITAADMEQYRLREKRVRLTFENGFEIELYSAKELFVQGNTLNINNYPVDHASGQLPVFNILPSGHLMAKVFTEVKK